MPQGSEKHSANQNNDVLPTPDDEIEPPADFVKQRIIQDLVANAECASYARHFSPELLIFSFITNMYSSLGYRFI
jgi:hypothetical protein